MPFHFAGNHRCRFNATSRALPHATVPAIAGLFDVTLQLTMTAPHAFMYSTSNLWGCAKRFERVFPGDGCSWLIRTVATLKPSPGVGPAM